MKSNNPKYMICYKAKTYCSEDISKIENYDAMMADNTQIWHCHHRREIDDHKSRKQLISDGLYYNRPASELIFMTISEHISLHHKFNKPRLGKWHSDATIKKMSEAKKGLKFWNNGVKQVRARECPEGFTPGRLRNGNMVLVRCS